MALKKLKTLPTGVGGEYWRIPQIGFNAANGCISGKVFLYVDKEKRDAGCAPIEEVNFAFVKTAPVYEENEDGEQVLVQESVPYAPGDFESLNIYTEAYTKLKGMPEFDGAMDV
jgi:hypothetical protein